MKRTPLERKTRLRDTPLRPGSTPMKRTRRPKSGAPRRATGRPSKRFAKSVDEAYRDYVRELDCCNCGHPGPSHAHHVRTRGAGGADHGNLAPLCPFCHREVHEMGRRTFAMMYERDLPAIATQLEARWLAAVSSDTKERT